MAFMQYPRIIDKQSLAIACIPSLIETIEILGEQVMTMNEELKQVKRLVKLEKPVNQKLSKCERVVNKIVTAKKPKKIQPRKSKAAKSK